MELRRCFREPIPEIFDVARYLDAAVSAHQNGELGLAAKLFTLADCSKAREWLESIWGKKSPYINVQKMSPSMVQVKVPARAPTAGQIDELHQRDGFHCRYCGIPVIRKMVRAAVSRLYPGEVPWGRSNRQQHAGFQVLWAQYDHVVPHSAGGTNELDNLVVACAACNFGKMAIALRSWG